jgi:tail assembly chaperone E/41/14-like protein
VADQDENPDRSEAPMGNGKAGEIRSALRKPIQANGEEVSELVFREPNGGDIERAGNPVIVDVFSGDTIKLTFDEKKMTAMMSRLAAVPPSSIRQLHPKDWNSIAWQLVHFFTPDL